MKDKSYLRTPDGRPIYFLGFVSTQKAMEKWGGLSGFQHQIQTFRERANASGVGVPYVVVAGALREVGAWASKLDEDAIGAYALGNIRGAGDFKALALYAESAWDALAANGFPVVPTVITGFDRRPQVTNPVPWEKTKQPGAGIEYYFGRPHRMTCLITYFTHWDLLKGSRQSSSPSNPNLRLE